MSLTLTIDGVTTILPTDKPWSIAYAPDVTPQKPRVTDLAAAIAAAKPGATIDLAGDYTSKAINVTVPGLTIRPQANETVTIHFNAEGKKDTGLFTLRGINGFNLSDVTVIGNAKTDAASYVVRSEGASNVNLARVRTRKHADGSGSGIAVCNGVNGITLVACSTEFTTVYSFYCGGSQTELNNKNITIRNCSWGKTNSHNMRTYGVLNMLIEDCLFDNRNSKSGRQCIKVMNGENVSIKRTLFDGTTRFGRDVNDPEAYSLKNCVIEGCSFNDWTRVDKTGGNPVTYRECNVHSAGDSFVFHLFDKTILEDVTANYLEGHLASNSKNIVAMRGVTFNGQAVNK